MGTSVSGDEMNPQEVDGSEIPENGVTPGDEVIFLAPPWKLMWWKFREHKLAVTGAIVVLIMYSIALFAGFIAPYGTTQRLQQPLAPPQIPRFISEDGFSLRPFVYGLKGELDRTTFERVYVPDTSVRYPVRFFVRGTPYKFLGLIPANLKLFGVPEGGTVYLMGTDRLGRDVFSRMIVGAQVSLTIGLVGVFMSLIFGIVLGGMSGYFGGTVDNIIQRLIEMLQSFPTIPLWMALAAAMPPFWSPVMVYFAITIILSLVGWTSLARVVRGRFLSLREEDFVVAARLSAATEARIIRKHLLPSFTSHIIASITLSIPGMILAETALSFLGVGMRPPAVSWGVMLQDAQNIYSVVMAPWLMLPGIPVVVTVLAFNFLGDGLRDAADPYAGLN